LGWENFPFLENRINILYFLGSTKYDMAASAEEEKERIDKWNRFFTVDDDEDGTQLISFIFFV
jgi:hypothetical protein